MKKTLVVLAIAGLLSACGGSSNDNSSNGVNPPNNGNDSSSNGGSSIPNANTKTGVFLDGKIAGVNYKTTSGLSGTTNNNGEFFFNEGDSVTFSIANVQIGESTKAKAHVTPLDLSQDQTVRNNLIVFLQSLDANANHDDGIQISAATTSLIQASNLKLNFSKSAADFAADADFKNLVSQSGGNMVGLTQALSNFQTTFYKDIQGAWLFKNADSSSKVLIYFDDKGNYILGEASPTDQAGSSGIEKGNIQWNASTGKLSPSISIDTNGQWGLSNPIPSGHFLNYGKQANTLSLTEGNAEYIFEKVKNKDNSIIGSWKMPDHVFSFFEDNNYFLLYTGNDQCANYGVEWGKYSVSGNTLRVTQKQYDTTGCSGLVDTFNDGSFDLDGFKLVVNKDSMSLQYEGEDAVNFSRVN